MRLKAARKKLQEVLRDYDKSKGAGAMTLNLTYITVSGKSAAVLP